MTRGDVAQKHNAGFDAAVYRLVARIPAGCVATYGQLAVLAGRPGWARRVGYALRRAPQGLPCYRVVNQSGRPAPGYAEQPALLRGEGVAFKQNGHVDMRRHRWRPE